MTRSIALCSILAITLSLLTGCSSLSGSLGSSSISEGDQVIAQEVLNRLKDDIVTGGEAIGVSVESGVVTLYGSTGNAQTAMRAEVIARNTDGVMGIIDRMQH